MSSFRLETSSHKETRRLMKRLARLREQWPSEPTLPHLSSKSIDGVLDYVAQREKERHGLELTALLFVGWAAVFGVCMRWYGMAIAVVVGECLFFWIVLAAAGSYRYAVYALTQTNDLRVLPTLIRATRYTWGKHPHVLYAIQRLLKQVTQEHVGLLNRDVLDRLDLLALDPVTAGETFDYDLALVTLNVFAKVGGDRELRDVKSIAKFVAYNAEQKKIVSIAQQLVPVMEARLQRQQVPATLLRAADTPTSAPDTLLRATHATTSEPPQQLLRASLSEHPETDA